jgi:hypothetical protein
MSTPDGVIAPHAFGRLKVPHRRWLGEVRWVEFLDTLHGIRFDERRVA